MRRAGPNASPSQAEAQEAELPSEKRVGSASHSVAGEVLVVPGLCPGYCVASIRGLEGWEENESGNRLEAQFREGTRGEETHGEFEST